jgi:hypothetical protein
MAARPARADAPKAPAAKSSGGMSDAALAERTGKTWGEWRTILETAGGTGMDRKEVLAVLAEEGVGPLWRQMIAARYERIGEPEAPSAAPAPKKVAPKPKPVASNLSVHVTRMVSVTLEAAYNAWERPTRRKRFLDTEVTFAGRPDGKVLRFGWENASRVIVQFVARSKTRTQVTIEHERLKTEDDVERLTAYWTETLDKMQALVEKTNDD